MLEEKKLGGKRGKKEGKGLKIGKNYLIAI